MSLRRLLPRLALALLFAAAVTSAALYRDQINLATLDAWHAWLGALGFWAPLGYVVLYALATFAFVPGVMFALAGGALFGPFWGSIWNLTGATLGATLAFLVARYLVGDWVARKAGGLAKRLIDGVDAEGWRFVAFVRLMPLCSFNLSNYALALTRIPLHHYVLPTLVCMAPGAVAYTWLGYAGRGGIGRLRFSFSWIEVGDLKRRLDSGEPITIIDVRGIDEFVGPLGHIATARNIPVGELGGRLGEISGLERKPIVLVCRTDKRSAAAAQTLCAAGFTQINVLRRGMEQWNDERLPVDGRIGRVAA